MSSGQQESARGLQVDSHRDAAQRPRTAQIVSVVVALVVGLTGGYLLRWTTEPTKTVTNAVTETLTAPTIATARTVTVAVDGLSGSTGSQLAVIVYRGKPALTGGTEPPAGLGGFAVRVDASPFSITETVREGSPIFYPDPAAAPRTPIAQLPTGTHTVVVWVSSDLGTYSEWVPAAPVERSCQTTITVVDDQNIVLNVGDVQSTQQFPIPTCVLVPPVHVP